jgi:hypothetical protein
MTTHELIAALLRSHSEDLHVIAQYVAWLKVRRHVHNAFYRTPAHWVQPVKTIHWV